MKKKSNDPDKPKLGRPPTKVVTGNAVVHRGIKFRIRRWDEMGLTQPKLVALLSEKIPSDILVIRVDTISGWELGTENKELSDDKILLIHEIMGVSKEYFDEPLPDEKSPTPHLSSWGKELQDDVPQNEKSFSEFAMTLRYLGNLEKLSPEALWQHTREYIRQIKKIFRYSNDYQILVYSLAQKRFLIKDFDRISFEKLDPPPPILLDILSNHHREPQGNYWIKEFNHLKRQLDECREGIIKSNTTSTLNVFALAPQPLVVELGHRLSDIPNVKIIQPYRVNNFEISWGWREVFVETKYKVPPPIETKNTDLKVALNLSLSTYIEEKTIERSLVGLTSLWTFTIEKPDDEFLKSENQLYDFKTAFLDVLKKIVTKHGKHFSLHVFLSVPIAIAFEIGRLWDPDTHPELVLYGLSSESGDYYPIHTISISKD